MFIMPAKIIAVLFIFTFSCLVQAQQVYSFIKNESLFFAGTTSGDIVLIKNNKILLNKKIATHTITAADNFNDGFLFTGNHNSINQISARGEIQEYTFPSHLSVVTSIKKYSDLVLLGHYSGFLSIWKTEKEGLVLKKIINLKRSNLALGYLSDAIYAIDIYDSNKAVVGTDSGWLFVISLNSEKILSEKPYSYWSSRGINSLSIKNNIVAVGACQNSTSDKNVFIFKIIDNIPFQIASTTISAFNPGDNNFVFRVGWISDNSLIASTSYGISQLDYTGNRITHVKNLNLNIERFASSFYIDSGLLFLPESDFRINSYIIK